VNICFGTDGIRGPAGTWPVDLEGARTIGRAVAAWSGGRSIFVGRDTRESGPGLAAAVIEGLVAGGVAAGDPALLAVARTLVGSVFLGAVTSAMLLGHWYLVQPGLARGPLLELVAWTGLVWPFELLVLLWPTGMLSVLDGSIPDGYNGLLGWFWVACTVSTLVLVIATRAAPSSLSPSEDISQVSSTRTCSASERRRLRWQPRHSISTRSPTATRRTRRTGVPGSNPSSIRRRLKLRGQSKEWSWPVVPARSWLRRLMV